MRFHVQTGGVTLTAQQPDNNVVRVALQALAAVLGGCQSLHTNGKDEALALPTEASARLALRTQQVIAFETGVADTVDPLGGSYAVEAATDASRARGGARSWTGSRREGARSAAIERGEIQREIQESAYRFQTQVEAGERVIVGVNRFQESGEERAAGHPEDRPRPGARSRSSGSAPCGRGAPAGALEGGARRARREGPLRART